LLIDKYLAVETGYTRLSNGQMLLALYTRMPGCKSEWVDWWYRFNLDHEHETGKPPYKKEIEKTENKSNLKFFGNFAPESKVLHIEFKLCSPTLYFKEETIKMFLNSGVTALICGQGITGDNTIDRHVIHVVRDTKYGCEMRSRFWMNDCPEEAAQSRLRHYMNDFGSFAEQLKDFIEHVKKLADRPDVTCKFCHSDEVVKNGIRKGTQYWLCKNCGRGFVNNNAMPRMKFSSNTMMKAVNNYLNNVPVREIQKDIEKESNILPSDSTIYGWIKKFTKHPYDKIPFVPTRQSYRKQPADKQ